MSRLMKTRVESPEVFYPGEEPVVVGASEIEQLKRVALASPKKRARLCTHQNPADDLHEMLIVMPHDAYVRPHRHLAKAESFSILEGEADLVLFHDDGAVRTVIPMAPHGSGKAFYYRLTQPVFHTVIVRSDLVLFHEVTEGPFRREQTEYASWSPAESDTAGIAQFLQSLPSKTPAIPVLS